MQKDLDSKQLHNFDSKQLYDLTCNVIKNMSKNGSCNEEIEERQHLKQRRSLKHNEVLEMLAHCCIKSHTLQQFPQSLLSFIKKRSIQIIQLITVIPRYVRIKPQYIPDITIQHLISSLAIQKEHIVQIDSEFYAINPNVKINYSTLYQQNKLYGMDIASAMPVLCLDIKDNMRILELCSAPGNKSMYIADHYQNVQVIGVEINQNRANVMKSLIHKYSLEKIISVKIQDGLTFHDQLGFQRVLVDAECTHEGSLKHIEKFLSKKQGKTKRQMVKEKQLTKQQEKQFKTNNSNPYTTEIKKNNEWSEQDFEERFLDRFKLQNLHKLQFGLLENGFKLLKDDGILVYSTCSYDHTQNQGIIQEFLLKHSHEVELIDAGASLNTNLQWTQGRLKGTLRFSPSVSLSGGMFVAKIKKISILEIETSKEQQKQTFQKVEKDENKQKYEKDENKQKYERQQKQPQGAELTIFGCKVEQKPSEPQQ